MKKVIVLPLAIVLITAFSCKKAKKEAKQEETKQVYTIVEDSTDIRFTAYKTTEKKPVGGTFTKISYDYTSSETAMETLNGLEFSIPVSSLFTNDTTNTRDPKILHFFFGVMENTELISGVLQFDENQNCSAKLTMNGVSAELPMEYEMANDSHFTFSGTMDLTKWNALEALASLNKACFDLHTGPDGVSKTWEDVAVKASILLEKK
ncbi:YceI family protein [Flagellimonas nanhaiensis]|uniref:Lipid/polyisoprenoid-binding YceI-like domain-containing protein n=1 Tax=Flagellimonas nanhaiensis TaxID=2292706 RepID=A0A371JTT2_9FLAO|nr:YceI family protein [Allomuricauda nanhaiensis]RDY61186.1 hypothetical protein DX873_03180 [Allomuricauda nanhaiensis]